MDQTWTEREVYSRSSQLSTPPTYGLRSRERRFESCWGRPSLPG
jgi:hypothetical protein